MKTRPFFGFNSLSRRALQARLLSKNKKNKVDEETER